jgi:hypothetical protein
MISKFFKSLANIPNDKLLHFFYGSIFGFILVSLVSGLGVLLCLAIAVLKEFYDLIVKSEIQNEYWYYPLKNKYYLKQSLKDIAFTVAPSIMMLFVQIFK